MIDDTSFAVAMVFLRLDIIKNVPARIKKGSAYASTPKHPKKKRQILSPTAPPKPKLPTQSRMATKSDTQRKTSSSMREGSASASFLPAEGLFAAVFSLFFALDEPEVFLRLVVVFLLLLFDFVSFFADLLAAINTYLPYVSSPIRYLYSPSYLNLEADQE